jgi:hypothetical protein
MSSKRAAAATLILYIIGAMGCTAPHSKVNTLAENAGFTRRVVQGADFEHVVYESGLEASPTPELHVYIDGDGTPWVGGRYPSTDPTPQRPIALQMMMDDPAAAIYLGRPCYLGLSSSPACNTALWTSQRYSQEVVNSMLRVIRQYRAEYTVEKIVLIGYSGGGALAALLARDIEPPLFFLTVGANLDTQLWTDLRGFLPLDGSLNPVDYRLNSARTPQLHLAGAQDKVVPVAVTKSYALGLDTRFFRYYPDFDHACCWLETWPEILLEKPWAAHSARGR